MVTLQEKNEIRSNWGAIVKQDGKEIAQAVMAQMVEAITMLDKELKKAWDADNSQLCAAINNQRHYFNEIYSVIEAQL